METSLFLSVFLLKLLKKRPRATLHVISGFMSSEKPVIKICMNVSLRLVFRPSSGERRRSKPIVIFTKMGGRPFMFLHLPSPFIPIEPTPLLQSREA